MAIRSLCVLLLFQLLPAVAHARYGMCPEGGCNDLGLGALILLGILLLVGGLRGVAYFAFMQIAVVVILSGGAVVLAFIGKQLFGETGGTIGGVIGFAITIWVFLRWDRASSEKGLAEHRAQLEHDKRTPKQASAPPAATPATANTPAKPQTGPSDTYYAKWVYVPREDGTVPNDDQIKLMLAYRARYGVYPEKAPGQSKEEFLAMLIASIPTTQPQEPADPAGHSSPHGQSSGTDGPKPTHEEAPSGQAAPARPWRYRPREGFLIHRPTGTVYRGPQFRRNETGPTKGFSIIGQHTWAPDFEVEVDTSPDLPADMKPWVLTKSTGRLTNRWSGKTYAHDQYRRIDNARSGYEILKEPSSWIAAADVELDEKTKATW